MSYIEVNDQNFEEVVVKSNVPVVVDFWAEWCWPCKMLWPIFEKLSNNTNYEWKIKFVKVNVENNPDTAVKYMIQWIPTIMIFKDWEPIKTIVWIQPEDKYKKELDDILKMNSTVSSWLSDISNIINVRWIEQFTQIIENNEDKLIIVDFWAEWCWPCKMFSPILDKIAKDYEWDIIVMKINVEKEENQQLAMQFKVSSIPTVAFINWKDNIETTVWVLPYETLKQIIDKKLWK